MTDHTARIRDLIDELEKLDSEREAAIQDFELLATPLREELNALRIEMYLAQSGVARLQSGDQILVTEAFWHEKRRIGAERNFSIGNLWDVGRPAVIESLRAFVTDSAGTLDMAVVIKGVEGAGNTSISYDTALDMRKAWLAANA